MGMFDSIYLDVRCPVCKERSEMECQTKQLNCYLDVWRKGDYVGKNVDKLYCTADCKSKLCLEISELECGYRSGFGNIFDVVIYLDNGVVNGKYRIVNDDEETRKVLIEKW